MIEPSYPVSIRTVLLLRALVLPRGADPIIAPPVPLNVAFSFEEDDGEDEEDV